jgi:dihydroorotase
MSKIADILVIDGIIEKIAENIDSGAYKIIDAAGMIIAPGFIDLHVHFREPGFEYKETIQTGAESAARGGYTTVCCMANTNPVVDNPETVKYIRNRANLAPVNLLQFGAATRGMAGVEPADIEGMVQQGISGISEDGKTVANAGLYLYVMLKAKEYGLTVFSHCEDLTLTVGTDCVRPQPVGTNCVRPLPIAEEIIISRDIMLAKETGAKLHICHLSTAGGAELVRQAKRQGLNVTCEVSPHHLFLTEDDITDENTNFKMSPPLRNREDAEALRNALLDGTIDCIATDHAPHSTADKSGGWTNAANGVTGLDCAFAVCHTELVKTGFMTFSQLIGKMSLNPARILGIDKGVISVGSAADIVIIDPNKEHIINAAGFASKGKNTPWHGRRVCGDVLMTILNGRIVYNTLGAI